MQQKVSWKMGLIVTSIGLSALAAPAWSQVTQPDLTTNTAAASALPAAGSDAKASVASGTALGQKGDLDGAIAAFNQAIGIDPKYAPAYYGRGFAFALQGKPDDAISNYDQAIQLAPDYKAAYYQRGSLKGQKGDFDGALADFNAVIKLDPKYAPAYYNAGHVYYFKGDLANAGDQIDKALALAPKSPFSYFIRGLVQHAQGQREAATADFQKSSDFNFPIAVYWTWITQMEAGQLPTAKTNLSLALTKPEMFHADDWPSQIGNFLLGNITRDDLLAKAKTANPNETQSRLCEAWFYAGMYELLSHGAPDKAKDCFNQAVSTGSKGSEEFIEANRQLSKM
jgi:tetratricopeptide (TPR) repeat protein